MTGDSDRVWDVVRLCNIGGGDLSAFGLSKARLERRRALLPTRGAGLPGSMIEA